MWNALLLTVLAGLATGVGSAIALFAKRTDTRMLSIGLSFSAGVMLYVSFTEILTKANDSLAEAYGPRMGGWAALGAFLLGLGVVALIDKLVPTFENPHEPRSEEALEGLHHRVEYSKLHRLGLVSALAIAIHNFPEGAATFFAALEDPKLGIAIAVAIALHNIPEGVSVAVPLYYATGSKTKAFLGSFATGLAEPLGAILGYLVLRSFLTPATMGFLFAAVAGIMVFLALDELLPTARAYGRGHESIYGVAAGMAVMAASLILVR